MRKALNRCCRNVRWKDSVVGYELHAPQNTHKLINSLRDGTYKISPYHTFMIHEPKTREIVATRIADRQVQMALCMGGLYEDFTEHFIYDNCACQTGKGTDFAIKRVKKHLVDYYREHGRDGWVLKLDVHKFFPSTRHDVAKEATRKRISDPKACKYVCDVIDSFAGDVGIGLGSQISQLVELAVLDDIDHYIKERLHIKHYVRYMDDLLIIHEDREYLNYCKKEIAARLEIIGLSLNKKSTLYPLRQGVKFLNWHYYYTKTGRVIMKMSKRKMGKQRQKLRKLVAKENAGLMLPGTAENSLVSWLANAERGDAFYQRKQMQSYYERLKGVSND